MVGNSCQTFDIGCGRVHADDVASVSASRDVRGMLAEELTVLAGALREGSLAELSALGRRLAVIVVDPTVEPEWLLVIDALRQACDAAGSSLGGQGLARQGGHLEAGSLPARMLGEVARGARVGNADLAELLGTDVWQLSRAGRRLRDAGLATRVRSGRINVWALTADGREEIDRLRAQARDRRATPASERGRNGRPTEPVSLEEQPGGGVMSDNAANREIGPKTPTTVAEVLHGIEPMGDLRQFAIDDLTPDDEDEFFRIIENA